MKDLSQKVNEFITEELLSLDNLPKDTIPQNLLQKGIIDRLFSRRFRKYAISPEVKENVSSKLNNIIENKLPIIFIPSFGGYKHWWSPTYPEIDWAEAFNIKYVLGYLAPVYNSYKDAPVTIEYESEEVILSELNNVPQSGLDAYTASFRRLANFFSEKLDGKTEVKLTLARDLYDVNKLKELISASLEEHEARFDSYEPEDQERRIKKVETNYLLKGVVDYSNLSKEEIYELYRQSRILNETFLDADFELRPNYFEGESSIPLLFSFGLGPGGEAWIHIGSCSTSMVDFWAGMGILEYWQNEDKFVPRIISRSQYEIIKNDLIEVGVSSAISSISKNFSSIYVFDGKLNFGSK